jgi:hypothetical protein
MSYIRSEALDKLELHNNCVGLHGSTSQKMAFFIETFVENAILNEISYINYPRVWKIRTTQ